MGIESYFYKINRKIDDVEELNKLEKIAISKTERIDFEIVDIINKEGYVGVINNLFKDKLNSTRDMLFLDYKIACAKENVEKYYNDISNALSNGKSESEIIIKEYMGYLSDYGDLQRYMKSLYQIKNLTGDMNCINFILTKEDLNTLILIAKLAIKGEYVPKEKGFNWSSENEDWNYTIKIVEDILKYTDFDKETIYYYSWW